MRITIAQFVAAAALMVPAILLLSTAGGESGSEHYSWGENIRVTYTGTGAFDPDCVTDDLNNTHMVYESERTGNAEIYYTVLDWRDNKLVYDIRITNASGSSLEPRIAVDGNGSAHVVWQDNRTGSWGVYYARLDADRNLVINDTLISGGNPNTNESNLTGANNATSPALCTDGMGGIYIIWMDDRDRQNGTTAIYYEKIVPDSDDNDGDSAIDGMIREFDDRPLDDPATFSYAPRIACGGGEVHAAWYGLVEGNYDIFYAELEGNTTLVNATRVTTASSIFNLDIATDRRDRSHIVWSDDRWGNFEIYYTLMADGLTLTDDTRITNGTGSSANPTVALYMEGSDDDEGNGSRESPGPEENVYIAWQDEQEESGQPRIFYSKIDPARHEQDGSAADFNDVLLVPATVLESSTEKAQDPEIAVNKDGYIVIVREDHGPEVAEIVYRHSEKPDLIVATMGLIDPHPDEGDILELEITIDNAGAGLARISDARVIWSDGLVQYGNVPSIPGKGMTTILVTRMGVPGPLEYSVFLDANDTVDELNEDNNQAEEECFVRSYGLFLTLTEDPVSLDPGGTGEFVITVTNTGNFPAVVNLSVMPADMEYPLSDPEVSMKKKNITIELDGAVEIIGRVRLPQDELAGESGYRIWASSGAGKADARMDIPLTVNHIHEINLKCDYPEQASESSAEFMFEVENKGNGQEDISIFLDGDTGTYGWLTSYFESIPAFSGTSIILNATIPSHEPAGDVVLSLVARSMKQQWVEDRMNFTVVSLQRYGCELVVEPENGTIELNGTFSGTLEVENTGNKNDLFSFEYDADVADVDEPDDEFKVVFEALTLHVGGGETAALNYTVTAPIKKVAGPYTISFTAFAGDGKTGSLANLTLTVLPFHGAEVTLMQALPQDGNSKSYLFNVNNTGNEEDTYTFTTSEPSDWSNLSVDKLTVGPYSTQIVNVTVTAEEGYRLEGYYVFLFADPAKGTKLVKGEVTVHEDFDIEEEETQLKPFYLKWWFFVTVIGMIAGVVFYLFVLGGKER